MNVLRNGTILIPHLEVADCFFRRLVGYMGRKRPPEGHALHLAPCRSIHTCFMRFRIDVVFLDRTRRVVGIAPNLRPWRIALGPATAVSIIELPAGSSVLAALRTGDTLDLQRTA